MKIRNRHERIVTAPPERIAALIADFDRIWPRQIAPTPRLHGHRLYDAGLMLWEEFDRPGAARAFRVVRPDELEGEHWFELELGQGATVLRHTIEGYATGAYEAIWHEQIERFMTWYLRRSSTTSKPQPQPTQQIRTDKHTEDRQKGPRRTAVSGTTYTAHVDDQIAAHLRQL